MKKTISLLFYLSLQIAFSKNQIIVAVIDTGMDLSHECLQQSLYTNTKEIPNNGIDDDKNSLIDDVNGWNFIDNDNNITDVDGHGTHISGLISPLCNKISPKSSILDLNIKILPIKYYDSKRRPLEVLNANLKAIEYAIQMKVDIINFSGGGYQPYGLEKKLIKKAQESNIILVASAGNNKSNNDIFPFYPASYSFNNIISVAAVDTNLRLPNFSNFGKKTVLVAAKGTDVMSTLPHNKFGTMSGTSQATALVTNKLAIQLFSLKSSNRVYKKWDLVELLEPIAKISKNLAQFTKTSFLIN